MYLFVHVLSLGMIKTKNINSINFNGMLLAGLAAKNLGLVRSDSISMDSIVILNRVSYKVV